MSRSRPLPRWLGSALLLVAACVLTLIVVEGCSSLALLAYDLGPGRQPGLTSRVHMQHDTLVGWVNQTRAHVPDLFGKGVDVTTNSLSFRGRAEYDRVVPADRVRVLCSGDSFTFGYGVGDEQSWCARLQARDPRLETVNLGHSGFGLDQSYLFYRRIAQQLEHDIHVIAFVPDDVRRLTLTRFIGYPKPYYRIEQGQLALHNVPVPMPSRWRLWQTYNSGALARARSIEFGTRLLGRVARSAPRPDTAADADAHAILLRLIDDLDRLTRQHDARFLVVLLDQNFTTLAGERQLQRLLSDELPRRGIAFLDMRSRFRELSAERLEALFDRQWNHYTPEGYDLVAAGVHDAIQAWLPAPAAATPSRARSP